METSTTKDKSSDGYETPSDTEVNSYHKRVFEEEPTKSREDILRVNYRIQFCTHVERNVVSEGKLRDKEKEKSMQMARRALNVQCVRSCYQNKEYPCFIIYVIVLLQR
jgi:hypothetical protein